MPGQDKGHLTRDRSVEVLAERVKLETAIEGMSGNFFLAASDSERAFTQLLKLNEAKTRRWRSSRNRITLTNAFVVKNAAFNRDEIIGFDDAVLIHKQGPRRYHAGHP